MSVGVLYGMVNIKESGETNLGSFKLPRGLLEKLGQSLIMLNEFTGIFKAKMAKCL